MPNITSNTIDVDDVDNAGKDDLNEYASPPCYLHGIDAAYRDNFGGSDVEIRNAGQWVKHCEKLDS